MDQRLTATATIPLDDMRRRKADAFVGYVLQIIRQHPAIRTLDREAHRQIANYLFDAAHKDGTELLGDYHRSELGLPPRGPDGWTREEIAMWENKRLEMMHALVIPQILP
jgi:hypothetical protein